MEYTIEDERLWIIELKGVARNGKPRKNVGFNVA